VNQHVVSFKNIFQYVRKLVLTIALFPILKKLGFLEEQTLPSDFPKSHYYETTTVYDAFVGLYNLPYSQAWISSKRENSSIRGGELIPWITYPALDFLERLTLNKFKVVEFGSGASTLWFARNCKEIKSYEFDSDYYDKIRKFVNLTHAEIVDVTNKSYKAHSNELAENLAMLLTNDWEQSGLDPEFWDSFNSVGFSMDIANEIRDADLIFIDGGPRNFLTGLATENAKTEAIIVVDNSDTEYVRLGVPGLIAKGFVEIPLFGPGPLNPYQWQTSIFVRSLALLRK